MNSFDLTTNNPFNNITTNTNNILIEQNSITIWKETLKRKNNTFISGWNISEDELKNHLKYIKKKIGCNGTIKKIKKSINLINENNNSDTDSDSDSDTDSESNSLKNKELDKKSDKLKNNSLNTKILQLQGDHINYMKNYLIDLGINKENIVIKG